MPSRGHPPSSYPLLPRPTAATGRRQDDEGTEPRARGSGARHAGTVKIFEDGEKYYALLLDRVGAMVKAGKSLDDIKKEVKMPEYSSWGSQDRFPANIEAAYKAVAGK